jgi:hypothetical protein
MNAYEELNYFFESEDVAEAFFRGICAMDQYSRHEIYFGKRIELSSGNYHYEELMCN